MRAPLSPSPDKSRNAVLEMSLWSLTWPMFLDLVLSMTLGLEDAFYLARISDRAAAAVGALLPILGVCNMVFQAFAQSGSSVASQLTGAGRHDRIPGTYRAMLVLNGGLGTVVALALVAIHWKVGVWLGLSAEVYPLATEFLGLVGPVLLVQALRFAYSAILASRGLTRWNMVGALAVNVTNLALNHLLTRGTWGLPRLGVSGIACSTLAAQTVGILLAIAIGWRKAGVRWRGRPGEAGWREAIRPILRIGLPWVIEPISYQLNQLVMVRLVVAIGDTALAARAYTLNLIIFAVVWSLALGFGTQLKVAHLVGARRFDEANRQLLRSLRMGMLLGFGMMVVLSLAARPIYSQFTHDPEILRLGQTLMLIGLALELARTSNVVVGGSLRGAGDARFTSLASVALTWGIAIPLAWFLAIRLGLGLVGIWIAMVTDEACRGLMNYGRWRSGAWKAKGVLAQECPDEQATVLPEG